MQSEILLRWIVLVPLMGAVINGLLNGRLSKRVSGLFACATVGVSFAFSVMVFMRLMGMEPAARLVQDNLGDWMGLGPF